MQKVIVIAGPTATGKTALSLFLAHELNGEIINADSTQVYEGLDIATAKVDDMEGIKHHLLSFKDIRDDYSVFDYQRDGRNAISKIIEDGKVPIIVGGTGLYIKALLYDYNFDNKINDYSALSNEELYDRVCALDSNNKIHINNRRRLERALSYMENSGLEYSLKKSDNILYDAILIGLEADRDILYSYINSRVDNMISAGLIDEARKIYDSGIRSKAVMTPIGYKELFDYFDGKCSLDDAISKIKQSSRRYAKRQFTWFKNQMNFTWFRVDYDNFSNTKNEVIEYVKKHL